MAVFWTLAENIPSYMFLFFFFLVKAQSVLPKAKEPAQPISLKRYLITAESSRGQKNGALTEYFVITAKTSIPFQTHL